MTDAAAPLTARGARTRAALVKAARALFERKGYLDTNVGDIAKRARVAHGTFYTYFSSKEEIFGEVADELAHQLVHIAEAEPHPPPGATLSAAHRTGQPGLPPRLRAARQDDGRHRVRRHVQPAARRDPAGEPPLLGAAQHDVDAPLAGAGSHRQAHRPGLRGERARARWSTDRRTCGSCSASPTSSRRP